MKRDFLAVLAVVMLWPVACTSSQLPEQRPDDFSVSVSSGGGMFPYSEGFTLSAESCRIDVFDSSVRVRVTFTRSAESLDALYATLCEQRFDHITTYEEEVFDRGGVSISVQAAGQRYEADDSGMSFIDERWREEFRASLSAAAGLYRAPEAPVTFEIRWAETLRWGQPNLVIEADLGSALLGLGEPPSDHLGTVLQLDTDGPSFELRVHLGDAGVPQSLTIDPSTQSGVLVDSSPAGLALEPIPR